MQTRCHTHYDFVKIMKRMSTQPLESPDLLGDREKFPYPLYSNQEAPHDLEMIHHPDETARRSGKQQHFQKG